LTLYFC